VFRVHPSLKKTIHHVDSHPDLTFCTVCEDVINSGQGVTVSNSIFIELTKIIDPSQQHIRVCFRHNESV
jgi:hypothetical protein